MTGVQTCALPISVEAAIRQYVEKYAKTAKIKNIVDTFMHKLDEVGCFEETKRELAKNRDESEKIVKHIEAIRANVDDVNNAKKFKDAVDDSVIKVNDATKNVINGVVEKYQARLTKRIDDVRGEELEVAEAQYEVERLERFAKKLEPDFQTELDELIHDGLIGTSSALIEEYKQRLASFVKNIELDNIVNISIDPIKLMKGTVISADDFSIKKLVQSKEVEDGREWVENTDKKWWKPWTWFQEKGYYRTKYKKVKYVDASELAQQFLAPIQEVIYDNGDGARQHALKQSNRIANSFNEEFKRLDSILKQKLSELESFAVDKEKAEERICASEKKLKWLETVKTEVESILEI